METGTIVIVVSAVVSVVVVPVSTLLGVLITQRNNRETKRLELEANRNLKTMELEEQSESTKRQERREVYLELLRAYRMSVQYAAQMGHMALGQQFQVDIRTVGEAQERFKRLIPELEIVGSDEVRDLLQELYRATAKCNDVMYTESEKRFALFDQRGTQPSPQQKAAIWKEVSTEVQKAYNDTGMESLYARLRTQVRKELGFTPPDTDPTLSPEEEKKLHRQLLNMDQMRLRSSQQNTSGQS